MSQQVYMNRELSWLKFNERVLEEAENKKVPLCERLTFASIYQSNLDEFFRVRVGSLVDQMLLGGKIRDNKTKMTAKEQIEAVLHQVMKLNRRKDAVYDAIMGQLEDYGVRLVDFRKISKKESEYLEKYFLNEIAPVISPTIVGKRQPFPFLKNNEIYAVVVLQTKSGKEKLGIIPCSNTGFKRLVELPTAGTYMLAEELILHYIPEVFERYNIKAKSLIRVTRNADIDADALYDEDLDYRDFMAELIKRRKKLAPVRLELTREMDGEIVDVLCDYLELDSDYVFQVQAPLDLSFVFEIQDTLRKTPELFYEKRVPQKSSQFRDGEPVFPQIREKDKLLSYPYESMKPFLNFLREAANDKEVISICPEVLAGMETPRPCAEIVNGRVVDENGNDVSLEYNKAVAVALSKIQNEEIDLVILQSRSPTCGVNQIYDGSFTGKLVSGMGLFAKALKQKGYHVIDVEEI